MPLLRFVPLDRSVRVATGSDLLSAARGAGVPLGSSCDGQGACGWCRVIVVEGASALSLPEAREEALMRKLGLADDERLACQARLEGDATVATEYWGYRRSGAR